MGTNDGSRNFSANCDLERSMSTQTNVLALAGGSNVAIKAQAAGAGGGHLVHALVPSRLRLSHLVHSPLPHTPRGKKKTREIRLHCPSLRVRERP